MRALEMLHAWSSSASAWRFSTIMRLPSSNSHPRLVCSGAHAQASSSSSSSITNKKQQQQPWLLVGLGNPGKQYQGTRHNVGFDMIDTLADAEGIRLSTTQHKALIGKGEIGSSQVLLAKPQTFMNLSGQSVGPLSTYYRIPSQQILVIYDDMDLEFGAMRLLPRGGHGGHNGMRSIIEHLKGSRDFPRLKIGIGRPPGKMDPAAFVLRKFGKDEREEMDVTMARGMDAIRKVILKGLDNACSTCNEPKKSQKKASSGKEVVQSA